MHSVLYKIANQSLGPVIYNLKIVLPYMVPDDIISLAALKKFNKKLDFSNDTPHKEPN